MAGVVEIWPPNAQASATSFLSGRTATVLVWYQARDRPAGSHQLRQPVDRHGQADRELPDRPPRLLDHRRILWVLDQLAKMPGKRGHAAITWSTGWTSSTSGLVTSIPRFRRPPATANSKEKASSSSMIGMRCKIELV